MHEMDISTEGNGPSEDQREVLSPSAMDSNQQTKETEKVTPAEMCRQVSTAFKEMDVIDTVIVQSQRSDLPQDYVQMNENLLKKRQYLVEWVSRFKCPITNCPVHYLESKASKISDDNSNAKKLNVTKPKTKRNANEISHSSNDSREFKTPNKKKKKIIAKSNYISSKTHSNTEVITSNQFNALSNEVEAEDETTLYCTKLRSILFFKYRFSKSPPFPILRRSTWLKAPKVLPAKQIPIKSSFGLLHEGISGNGKIISYPTSSQTTTFQDNDLRMTLKDSLNLLSLPRKISPSKEGLPFNTSGLTNFLSGYPEISDTSATSLH
ncbi:hypothetical protein CEXT_748221 [Caerostris extrusa]|uniref:Uncharacterized protein n=1 Tax=Caerostris extrusa TaxID=172846 RepID=A0AAV4XA27_CAEEX|nr:hypothetical protein CEXT_748221 [Caerostris extrusa]